jgi:hypothetical protein
VFPSRSWVYPLFLALASAQPVNPPSFKDYRVARVYRGRVKPPEVGNLDNYSGTDLRCFGGAPAEYVKERVNFAGHFVIGTCRKRLPLSVFWDVLTGRFYPHFPFGPVNVGPYGLGESLPPVEYKGEEYRVDSSLLVVEGCIEGTCDCATRYYALNGKQFKLVLRRPVRMPPDCLK